MTTSYTYLGGAAWHSDDDPVAPAAEQSWADYRGYSKVIVHRGTDPATWTTDEYTYYRGMYGDWNANGTTDVVNISTATGDAVRADYHQLRGRLLEHRRLTQAGTSDVRHR